MEDHDRRRRGMAPVCLRAGLITPLCQTNTCRPPNRRTDVVFAEHSGFWREPRPTSCGCCSSVFLAGFLTVTLRALRSPSFVTPTPCPIVSQLCEVFHSG